MQGNACRNTIRAFYERTNFGHYRYTTIFSHGSKTFPGDLAFPQPPSQALVSVFMQVPNWDISLSNATESLYNDCELSSL